MATTNNKDGDPMPKKLPAGEQVRRNFGKIPRIVAFPNLVEMQRESYARFLQADVAPEKRKDTGLQGAFNSVFPIQDFTGTASLEFVSYSFGDVKYDEAECIDKGMTYEIPMRITVRLVVYETDKETEIQNIRDIKEQEIYFGTIPLMTKRGTFIINGTERVVVSQLHRSPGVFFDHDKGKTHSSGKVLYSARIIPVRGSWIDLEIDPKDVVYVRIDRRRKFPVTLLLKAFGYSAEEILSHFYRTETIYVEGKHLHKGVDKDLLVGMRISKPIKHPGTGEILVKKGHRLSARAVKQLASAKIDRIPIGPEDIENTILAHQVVDPATGEVIANCNEVIDNKVLEKFQAAHVSSFAVLHIDNVTTSDSMSKTLQLDKVETKEEALLEIYRRLRPSNPPTIEVAQELLRQLFFSPSHYDLSPVGRLKTNLRLGFSVDQVSLDVRTLRKEDILYTTKILVDLKDTQGTVDDIDHLGNRRVRAVGELLESQYRIGLVRMERAIRERMSLQEIEALMPHDLINSKPVSAVIKEFFGTSQLSQFMDQTNPLSEITHKRRLSALGPGGLTRERAGFEVRDVHPTHYGRICPIETPEGPNIGLIVSLSTYARVNEFSFIETPYRVVKNAQVTNEVRFLSALDEERHPIAQANAPLDANGRFVNPMVSARVAGEFSMVKREDIELMDISPHQLVSVAASLIPFLENDDANRALMGSNMQRQAVPLLVSRAPLVATGVEEVVARDSGVTVVSDADGEVVDVDAKRIVIKHGGNGNGRPVSIYNLTKFARSNQNTCFNHRPIVKKGDLVKKGDIVADGPATRGGELALGKNVMVAFMPWGGYNFEDSILVSERLVRDGVFTSLHIEQFETVARDTKLGKEEITRDISNVGEEALKNLDDSGIIRLGAEIKPGDILVGKITPKGETQLSPEEKLLRAIFGEKAGEVKDTSLRVPPGVAGVVIDAKVFSRKGVEKDSRALSIEKHEIAALERDRDDELSIVEDVTRETLTELLVGQTCVAPFKRGKTQLIKKGERISAETLSKIPLSQMARMELKDASVAVQMNALLERYREKCDEVRKRFENQVDRYDRGDDLPPGIIKMVKVYVAMKRRLSVGDKVAGRHGNKGVVSCILPEEDMPYFEDGTPVDVVLNPLGVPSRMNVGQILETHLGWAAKGLGDQLNELVRSENYKVLRKKLRSVFPAPKQKEQIKALGNEELIDFAKRFEEGVLMVTPVFDGAKESEIKDLLAEAGYPRKGQATLIDGRTGQPFATKVTVGMMYVLKLHHLVDDKIHARSIGPYSLVTQQPLGGKAQFGGQRLGEMEVWATEAYGAAYALQEFLTVKSDDMAGRTRMYEKIVKGENVLEAGLPESFNVLVKELQGLGLDIELLEKKKEA